MLNTQQKAIDILEQIERAKQEWEVTADSLPQLICLLDQQGKILRANRTVEHWKLGRVEEVRGLTLQQLLHPNSNSSTSYFVKFWGQAWADLQQGQSVVMEIQDKWLGRYLEFQIRPIVTEINRKGRTTDSFAVAVIQDVTVERAAQHLKQQHERLAALGQLAAGIAHYFNNILTTIIGFAELLHLNPDISTSSKGDLQHIIRQGQRAAHLTEQILDFSRQSISKIEPVDFARLLTEIVDTTRQTIPKNIDISLEIKPNNYLLHADSNQMRDVIENLVSNAVDAMAGGGKLHFSLSHAILPTDKPPRPRLSAGDWVIISISDTGNGIQPDNLPRVFEPFFTTKEVGKGTGLGLAQVYGIIKQHGGDIEINSEINKGTVVNVYLPAV